MTFQRDKHMGRNLDPSSGCPHSMPIKQRVGTQLGKCQGHSLFVFDGVVTGIADPDLELEAHDGVAGALAAALSADGLPALPAVMLPGRGRQGQFCFMEKRGNGARENTLHTPLKLTAPSTDTRDTPQASVSKTNFLACGTTAVSAVP